MSQQPQPRPWFRLASLARPTMAPPPPPPPAPTQAPPPRPPFLRPTLTQAFAPPPPPPAQTPPSPPPVRPPTTASPPTPPPRAAATPPPKTPPQTTKPSNPSPKPSPHISPYLTPQSPKPKTSAPSSSLQARLVSPPPSMAAAAASPITATANAARMPTPPLPSPQIPKYNEPKTPSPKNKTLTSPPSPFTLPPPQLIPHSDHEKHNHDLIPPEPEQKTVMVHNNVFGNTNPLPKENHGKKEKANNNNSNINHHTKKSDSEDIGMSLITLAGENRGAIMELTPSRNGHFATNRHRKNGNHNKSWSDGEKLDSDNEGKTKHRDKNGTGKTSPFHMYTNSNVQGVNNSIMYNCSYTHNDPGVHLSLNKKKPKDTTHPHHS